MLNIKIVHSYKIRKPFSHKKAKAAGVYFCGFFSSNQLKIMRNQNSQFSIFNSDSWIFFVENVAQPFRL